LLWTGFGVGALIGALFTSFVAARFRPGLSQPLIAILWGGFLCPLMIFHSLSLALLCLALGTVCPYRSFIIAAAYRALQERAGLWYASCLDNCRGSTWSIGGRTPSPISRSRRSYWPFWYRMYLSRGRRIYFSNDAQPEREDEKRDQMSKREERSAFSSYSCR